MKNLFIALFHILVILPLSAQKNLSLQEIWDGEFRANYLDEITPMNDAQYYTVFKYDPTARETRIDQLSYTDQNFKETLLNSKDISIQFFESYAFSKDESKILLGGQFQRRYRYTKSGIFHVYDRASKQLITVSDQPIFDPQLSPDGSKIAYVFQNNLYVKDIASAEVIQLTTDGAANRVINGLADWVYEEEFELTSAYKWNDAGTKIAYLRFDETAVKEYDMEVYGSGNYPTVQTFKYPKTGEENSKVSAHIYDLSTKTTTTVDLQSFESYYTLSLSWIPNAEIVVLKCMNRHQNTLQLVAVDHNKNTNTLLHEEKNDTYVEYDNHLHFLTDGNIVFTSEKDGFNQLYNLNPRKKVVNAITNGNWTVTDVYGINEKASKIYFQSSETSSIERQVYEIGLNGKNKRALTKRKGQHKAIFNSDFSLFIDHFSSATTPPHFTVKNAKSGKVVYEILNNDALSSKLQAYNLSPKEFKTISLSGNELNYWILKPTDFDASKKYPVLLYQYSGPNSQMVGNKWLNSNDMWFQLLAKKGYVIACLDGRGTGQKGQKFKTLTQNQLGKYETEDQIAFAKHLADQSFIDAERVGIFGWSYGGTTALNSILLGNDVFKTAIAVAPVTNWRYYDTVYTERFMKTPQENAAGYDTNSPIFHANKLKGNLLLVHGSADDNVHFQNSVQMISALNKAGKQFDFALYPDKNHGIYGGNTRLHLYTKMTDYLLKKL